MYSTALRELRHRTAGRARRARSFVVVLTPVLAGLIVLYALRKQLFGADVPVRAATAVALVAVGWAYAGQLGRALRPLLFSRLEPGTAATVGFLIRLLTLLAVVVLALRMAGLHTRTLAVGGALTAVVLGLAAQQTLGNVMAGGLLLSARPFRIGDRVRLQGGPLAGQLEGEVGAISLLYTTLHQGADTVLVPNSAVLGSSIVPLREPSAVALKARLHPGVRPSEVQALLDDGVRTETRGTPHVALEEVDRDEVVVSIYATPAKHEEGANLADEVLAAIAPVTFEAEPASPDGAAARSSANGR